jgi:nitroreductase
LSQYREPNHDIHPLILDRWSSRSFEQKEIPSDELNSLFEAARWAPSAMNAQPWKFIVATSENDKETFNSFIYEGNLTWCKNASVYALLYSDKYYENGDSNRAHGFDAGAASMLLALEAENQGLATHMMGGFDQVKAREVLKIPDHYDLHVIIAIGYRGAKEKLPEGLQLREQPNGRNPIESFVKFGI